MTHPIKFTYDPVIKKLVVNDGDQQKVFILTDKKNEIFHYILEAIDTLDDNSDISSWAVEGDTSLIPEDKLPKANSEVSGIMSSIDYEKLLGIEDLAQKNVQSDWDENDPELDSYILNRPSLAKVATSGAYEDLTDAPELATVATSGSYSDLSNVPGVANDITLGFIMSQSNEVMGGVSVDENGKAFVKKVEEAQSLSNSRVISLNGGATGSVSFDGSEDVVLETQITNDSHTHTLPYITDLSQAVSFISEDPTDGVFLIDGSETVTQSLDDNSNKIATTEFVNNVVDSALQAAGAMHFKSSVASASALPATGNEPGDTYISSAEFTLQGESVEPGDMIVYLSDSSGWKVIQSNIDGAVTGPLNSVNEHIVLFDGSSGKLIKDSGKTISDIENEIKIDKLKVGDTVVPPINKGITISSSGIAEVTYETGSVIITVDNTATEQSDGLMSSSDKAKLDGIESGAQVNVIESISSDDPSIIFNKSEKTVEVEIAEATSEIHGLMSSEDKEKLDGISVGAQANVQSDWSDNNAQSDSYIVNRTHYSEGYQDVIKAVLSYNILAYYVVDTSSVPNLNPSNTYNIDFDGEIYRDLQCYLIDGYPYIGNSNMTPSPLDVPISYDLPIAVGMTSESAQITCPQFGSHTVKVYEVGSTSDPWEYTFVSEGELHANPTRYESGMYYEYIGENLFEFSLGEEFKVNFNGTEYDSIVKYNNDNDYYYVAPIEGENSHYHISIHKEDGSETYSAFYLEVAGSELISGNNAYVATVKHYEEVVFQLDRKYIEDSLKALKAEIKSEIYTELTKDVTINFSDVIPVGYSSDVVVGYEEV